MSVSAGQVEKVDVDRKLKKQTDEERKLAVMMIPKKKKYLYDKIMFGKKRKAREVGPNLIIVAYSLFLKVSQVTT